MFFRRNSVDGIMSSFHHQIKALDRLHEQEEKKATRLTSFMLWLNSIHHQALKKRLAHKDEALKATKMARKIENFLDM